MNFGTKPALILEVGEADFDREVLRAEPPVLAAFLSPWSRPCEVLSNVLEEVATGLAGKVKVVKVNADDNPDLALWHGIQSVPTLLLFVHGQVRATMIGTVTKEAIAARLAPFLADGGSAPLAAGVPAPGERLVRRKGEASRHRVNLFCDAPAARSVSVIGDFNDWQPAATPMQRMPDGRWMVSLDLAHGYHQYLFLVDGRPMLDPNATGRARNERNEPVSLIAVS